MIFRRLPSPPGLPMAFGELDEMRRGMERLFDSLAGSSGLRSAGVFPAVNVSEDATSLFVRAELPGIRADDLEVTMENETLTIAGERAMPAHGGKASCHRREREWGKFRRSLSVPVPVDANNIRARYADGILTIMLAKAPEARPKRISVQAES